MATVLTWFRNEILTQHERWVLWLPVPLACGIGFYFSLQAEPSFLLGPVMLGLVGVLCGAFYRDRRFLPLWLGVFLFTLGFSAAQFRTAQIAAPVLYKKTYPVTLSGRVVEIDPLPQTNRIVLENLSVVSGRIWQDKLPDRVRLKLKRADATLPAAGDVIEVKAVLLPLSPPVLPYAFDFQRFAFFDRLGATGYAIGDVTVTVPAASGEYFFSKLRRTIRARVEASVTDPGHAGLLTAFMIGESHGIPEDIWDIARLSGIAHLIAISGSHFILIAGVPFFLVRFLLAGIPFVALRYPIKKIAAVVAMAVSVFYMLLIGAPIPAQRAVLTVTIVMLAIILDRDPLSLRLAAFSALFILLLEPESLVGASFQLSFAAIVALIAFYEATRTWWQEKFREPDWPRRWSFYLIGCFATTLVASTATAPFAMYHFSRIPLVAGWVANMVAVPISSFITFPLCLIACVLMPFGLEKPALIAADKSLDIVMSVAAEVAGWPSASLTVDAWPVGILVMLTLGGLWFLLWQGRLRYIGLAVFVMGFFCIPLTPRPDMLIAESGRLVAVRSDDGKLWLSTARAEKFMRREWIVREGSRGHAFFPTRKDDIPVEWISCEKSGDICRLNWRGKSILTLDGEPVPAGISCPDIIISSQAIEESHCNGQSKIIDRRFLRQTGTIAAFMDDNGHLEIKAVHATRGVRPWAPKPRPWKTRAEWEQERASRNGSISETQTSEERQEKSAEPEDAAD